jgi:hypothetical protein
MLPLAEAQSEGCTMIEIALAFLAGAAWSRLYYARWGMKNEDWMQSSTWIDAKWWRKLHRVACWSCPKRLGCESKQILDRGK